MSEVRLILAELMGSLCYIFKAAQNIWLVGRLDHEEDFSSASPSVLQSQTIVKLLPSILSIDATVAIVTGRYAVILLLPGR